MNIAFAKEILHQLILQGVDYFCLAPGSRSTAFAVALSEEERAGAFIHFDERGLGFHALGFAKATGRPVAILVTSGTAVGNLLPAVMEACERHIPLILLTSDRPPELRATSANQTTDQVKVFGDLVRFAFDLPCPTEELPERFVATTIAQVVYLAKRAPQGPVHLNCMFREPFFSKELSILRQIPCFYEHTESTLSERTFEKWAEHLNHIEKGVIIAGSLPTRASLSSLCKLAERLDWPLFADIDSGVRSLGKNHTVVPHYDFILKTFSGMRPEAILQFGDRFVSKTLLEWIKTSQPELYCHIADHPLRADPHHLVTHRIPCTPEHFAENLIEKISFKTSWLSTWKAHAQTIEDRIKLPQDELSEPGILIWLKQHIPSDWALFFANSMPVRDAESFFYPERPRGPIFTNRGVSGIDGNIATIAGLAEGCKRPIAALIGDQTALHDLNSLAQLSKSRFPIILFIVNNYGGGIFSFLPIQQKLQKETFETYFAASHQYSFEHAADLFHLPYYRPQNWQELDEVPLIESCIIELITDRARNAALHQELLDQCSLVEI